MTLLVEQTVNGFWAPNNRLRPLLQHRPLQGRCLPTLFRHRQRLWRIRHGQGVKESGIDRFVSLFA